MCGPQAAGNCSTLTGVLHVCVLREELYTLYFTCMYGFIHTYVLCTVRMYSSIWYVLCTVHTVCIVQYSMYCVLYILYVWFNICMYVVCTLCTLRIVRMYGSI